MRKSCLGWSVVTAALTLLTVGPALAQPFPPTSFLAPTRMPATRAPRHTI